MPWPSIMLRNAATGPLPVDSIAAISSPSRRVALSCTTPDISHDVRVDSSSNRPHFASGSGEGRYSSWKISQISALVTSPPSASVFACTTPLNSICSLRGRSRLWSVLSR